MGAGDTLELARVSLEEGIVIQLAYLADQGVEAPQAISTSVDFSDFDPDPFNSHYEVEWMTVDLPTTCPQSGDLAQQAA